MSSDGGDYVYAVCPPHKQFPTRHEAVGFLAVHRRMYTYHPPANFRVETYEKRSLQPETERSTGSGDK